MASQTNTGVPGSGYGNVYIDSLIWGNAAWTNYGAGSSIRYWFGSGTWVGNSDVPAFTGPAWTQTEINATAQALLQFSEICGLTFTDGTGPTSAGTDIIAWKAPGAAVGATTLGMHEIPSGGSNPINGWYNYENTSWTANGLQLGGYAYITLIHEIGHGLGLAHPHDGGSQPDATRFPGVPADNGSTVMGDLQMNQGIWTMMSYHDGWINAQFPGNQVSNDYGWQASPMAFDVAALQRLYGANMNTRTGADTYRLPSVNGIDGVAHSFAAPNTGWYCVWDAGGIDTITNAGVNLSCSIDLRAAPLTGANAGGYVSWIGNATNAALTRIFGGYTIANGVVIENAIGGLAGDVLTGNDVANTITGDGGNDTIDGQGGNDTAVYSAAAASYTLSYNNGTITVLHKNGGSDGTDTLTSVEVLNFTDRNLSLVTFNYTQYLAANTDVLTVLGNNQASVTQHYVTYGFHENRATTFDGLRYIASYGDLINALGANADAGVRHFVLNGFTEGRQSTFDALRYVASYSDLINAIGTNTSAATQHFIAYGFAEGRQSTFDALRYVASYGDLINAMGTNTAAATQHYISFGFVEGRQSSFDALRYVASYGDLINAMGTNTTAATQHYVGFGFGEGRSVSFDPEFYLAKYVDLRGAFGTSTAAASQHYIVNGFTEGRVATNGGNDTLLGSSSSDNLNAGAGTDRITGGGAKDTLTGGSGVDTFVYLALGDTTNNSATCDIITDFISGIDKIDLSAIDANTATVGRDAFTGLIGTGIAFSAAGQLRLDGNVLYGSVNADATADFAIVLTGVGALNFATDFVA